MVQDKVRFLVREQVSTTKLLTIKDNIMASVFGYARVKKVITLAEDLHVHVVHDEETNKKSLLRFKEKLPIETRLYWEHFLRENKICWMAIPDEFHPC